MSYAQDTKVPVEKSQAEIQRMLTRAGASKFMSGFEERQAAIAFQLRGKMFRFILPLPDRNEKRFVFIGRYQNERASADVAMRRWEQACRSRWRALALAIKAKLEAVEIGLTTLEQEFLAFIVTDDGRTVGDRLIPQIESAAKEGRAPVLQLTYGGQTA